MSAPPCTDEYWAPDVSDPRAVEIVLDQIDAVIYGNLKPIVDNPPIDSGHVKTAWPSRNPADVISDILSKP